MSSNLNTFRNEFLGADTWVQRKDGVPLYLLDNLSASELPIAENELLENARPGDTWPIIGLGHIRSTRALPKLYQLLTNSHKLNKITVAHSIYQVCQDEKMIDLILAETQGMTKWSELIDIMYILASIKDERAQSLLNSYRQHSDYLVAYNATRAMGLPTDEVVTRFRKH